MTLKVVLLEFSIAAAALTGAFVCSMGAVHVEVRSKKPGGEHIGLIAPAMVLPVGAMMVPRAKIREAAVELRPWLPTLQAVTEQLLHTADATFVQIDNRREHVRIAKLNDALVIDVDDQEETVHVSVPLRAAVFACHRLAEKATVGSNEADRPSS